MATRFSSIVLCYAFFGTLLAVGCAAGLKYVRAGRFDCPDLFWTIPTALYVVAILHANNVREGGAWTLSSVLKPHKVKTQDFTSVF